MNKIPEMAQSQQPRQCPPYNILSIAVRMLDIVKSFLIEKVAPRANEIDSSSAELFQALGGLGKLNLLGLRIPQKWGGREVSEEHFGSFQELLARYSGALAFLQTQHQSAAGMIVASQNSSLQQQYLPRMGNGEVLLGVGFSQLRREGISLMVAIPTVGGYNLDGTIPWVTGYGLFSEFIVAATLPDGSAVFGIAPLQETQQESGGAIAFTTVAELAAMPSTNTVGATLTRWFLPEEQVVFIQPPGWIHKSDHQNILKPTLLTTGCALAGLDILEAASISKSLPFITKAFQTLQQELTDCRTAIREGQQQDRGMREKLQLRSWVIDLATRIAHAAVTVSSGSANYKHNNAQRVYREALVFTVTGQTRDVMEATLERLGRTGGINSKLFTINYSRVIHLSHVIDSNIPQWPGDPRVEFETVAELNEDGYYLRRFSLGEHSATHINAPISFHGDGLAVRLRSPLTIDRYPAESFVVPAVVIDICKQAAVNPDYTLSLADVLTWEERYGEITHGCVVLLHTGWQNKWQDKKAFFNPDPQGNMHFPGFGFDATEFLLEKRQIAGVGIDTHGVDSGQDKTFTINRLVLEKARIVLENLTNLDQLPFRGANLAIAPLLLQGGSGSPVGVLGLF
jgi:kynurenine formamidase/alkylation response protein AidB-like acyl-CoA dehydrogenase